MSLQATMIMLDNSAFALNGDYLPTRWETQIDAASLLIQSKLQSNLQSSIGLGLMGGRQVEILCTMTSDSIKANSYLFGIKIYGELHFVKALQIAALALKHRINQTQRQRIVCFIGSNIAEDTQTLIIIAKKMKKNNIAVDLICFGDISQQQKVKVQAFTKAVQNQQNSHYIFIQPGQVYLSEKLIGTKVFNSGSGEGGQPPNIEEEDPELAAAIRMSLEENQRQQPKEQPTQKQPEAKKEQQVRVEEPNEEQLEKLAIQLSLQESVEKKEEKGEQKKKQHEKQQKKQQ